MPLKGRGGGDELERVKHWLQSDRLVRIRQEQDTFQEVEANENFYMEHIKKDLFRKTRL